jgi:membrane associated rhomboid family serine protease
MKRKEHPFGSGKEAFGYAFLVLISMWLVYWAEQLFSFDFYKLGVLPRAAKGLIGVIFMPLIHSKNEIQHIVNNSVPIFLLLAALIYFYREIALKVFLYGWVLTGALVWVYAENKGSYHVGISGLIYLLASFLFVSGVIRKYMPLQAISLSVVFYYGSMIWGIFPMEEKVSWEGHLMGFSLGIVMAYVYREYGPQRPKYQYEVEKEMGIEPPDLEGIYNERLRQAQLAEEERERREKGFYIMYHYVPQNKEVNPGHEQKDETQH